MLTWCFYDVMIAIMKRESLCLCDAQEGWGRDSPPTEEECMWVDSMVDRPLVRKATYRC